MTTATKPQADLSALALAALGHAAGSAGTVPGWTIDMLAPSVAALRDRPGEGDRRLVAMANALRLDDAELMAVALCLSAEREASAARALAEVQHPVGGARILIGSAAAALSPIGGNVVGLACGRAVAAGVLQLGDERAPLPERSIAVPVAILAALEGRAAAWEGVRPLPRSSMPLPEIIIEEAALRARLLDETPGTGLVIRSASPHESLTAACIVAEALNLRLARVGDELSPGLAPWLLASGHLPVFTPNPGPGGRWAPPPLGFYNGPWIVTPGLDGAITADEPPDEWTLPIPNAAERAALWRKAGANAPDASRAAASFRQGAGRIAEAARHARFHAARRGVSKLAWRDLTAGISAGAGTLDALARRSCAMVPDDALVLQPYLAEALHRLLDRARVRSTLADGLGAAVSARYRPGVRALFTGESGTGKTLAAHWLATKLGLPLYRVDLAALTSKWIGETEKNLSAVLGAAEHADVLLFFDEADALFGARTEVSDAHDRYANAQTNFLLQRIEDFDGIALLASNSRDRFDTAFSRRLDAILEFPMPDAPARRDLWRAHLGTGHTLDDQALDRLAIAVDLAGGHIRNIVLAAAARAVSAGRVIEWRNIAAAVHEEYAKLGRPPPGLLQ